MFAPPLGSHTSSTFHPTSPHVSLDTYLQLLAPLSPTPNNAPQDKAKLPVEPRNHPGKRNARISTSRRWVYVPGGASDAQGFGRLSANGAKRPEEGERTLSSPANRGLAFGSGWGFPNEELLVLPGLPNNKSEGSAPPTPLRETCSEPARFGGQAAVERGASRHSRGEEGGVRW